MIEITLRTKDALEAIRRVAGEVEDCIVGAGTVLNPKQFDEAAAAGSKFIVSPGLTTSLISAAKASEVPLLPGAITPGEIMTALEAGHRLPEILPGRAGRRHDLPEVARLTVAGGALLPDRRRLGAKRGRISCRAQRGLRRRLLGRARRDGPRGQVGHHRIVRPAGERAEGDLKFLDFAYVAGA